MLSIYLILPAALGSGVYLASDRNKYHVERYIENVPGEYSAVVHEAGLTSIYEPTV
jgi:hypothetical protein